ncbi:hypothetical protein [Clostridium intestinale]|uniref:Haloacid dehalogenase n=1 Tax=Clostridium intestinale URNW TaxID=1294142 RepID=U2N2X6_9CLOT|nr:hypothetical protein [Clostridium intestinale]ERK29862.1 haloacid dehalogenase [Clostridium intestinale URNW]
MVIAAGDIGISKPNIDIFKVACEKAGMKGIWLNRNNLKLEFQGIDTVTNLNELTDYL